MNARSRLFIMVETIHQGVPTMREFPILLLAALTAFAGAAAAQSPVRVRGNIISFEGNVLTVKSLRDGKEIMVKVVLSERI